jgi:hypothetical protein
MKPMTRRNVLMLGGAAAVLPFGSASAAPPGDEIKQPINLVIKDDVVFVINNKPYWKDTPLDFIYYPDDSYKYFYLPFPWAPGQGLVGLLKETKKPPKHTITFEKVLKGTKDKKTFDHVQLSIVADDKQPSCCVMCPNEPPVYIPVGHYYLCNGAPMPCTPVVTF